MSSATTFVVAKPFVLTGTRCIKVKAKGAVHFFFGRRGGCIINKLYSYRCRQVALAVWVFFLNSDVSCFVGMAEGSEDVNRFG